MPNIAQIIVNFASIVIGCGVGSYLAYLIFMKWFD